MTLIKADIAEAIWNKTDIPKWRSTELVESILEAIKVRLESGEDFLISGFGHFCVKEKQERRGRNTQTGKAIMIAPRRVVTFKCTSVLRDSMNGQV